MIVLVITFSVIAVAFAGVSAFIIVNAFRMYAQMVKANGSLVEMAGNYETLLQSHVDRRVEVINQQIKKSRVFQTTPMPGPADVEPPTDDEIMEMRAAEERERREAIAAEFPGHPDGVMVE